jgi:hypothetical protein
MTTFTDSNLTNLKITYEINDVWNDARVMLPSYDYTLELVGETWIKSPINLQARATDGESINKYGRRTKTLNKPGINSYYAETYCQGAVDRYSEPMHKLDAKLIGKNAANIVLALNTKLSDQVTYINATSELNDTGIIDRLTLDIDLDGIPRLTMNITEARALELLNLFHIDVDLIDGTHVIG